MRFPGRRQSPSRCHNWLLEECSMIGDSLGEDSRMPVSGFLWSLSHVPFAVLTVLCTLCCDHLSLANNYMLGPARLPSGSPNLGWSWGPRQLWFPLLLHPPLWSLSSLCPRQGRGGPSGMCPASFPIPRHQSSLSPAPPPSPAHAL